MQIKGDTKKGWSVDVEITPAPAPKRAQPGSRTRGPAQAAPRSFRRASVEDPEREADTDQSPAKDVKRTARAVGFEKSDGLPS